MVLNLPLIDVVGDTRQQSLKERGPAILYVPVAQAPDEFVAAGHSWFLVQWVIRTRDSGRGVITEVQRKMRGNDPLTPISGFRTIDDVKNAAVRPWRFMMMLVSVFAGLALVLAAVGIYGVVSCQVELRRHEMGVFLALGATPGDIIRSVLVRGMGAACAGIVAGAAGSVWLKSIIVALLFGVRPIDPFTYLAAAAFMLPVAVIARLLPALRVTGLNPAAALRVE